MKKINFALLALIAFGLASCHQEDPVITEDTTVGKGVFVLNEGTYTFANSSLTFYNPETDTVTNNLFYRVNGSPIGDVAQSLTLLGDKLFIVVNNSNYIYKVNAKTMKFEAKIDGFYSPREMRIVAPNKAYVSDMIGTGVWIVNPQDMTHCGFVETGNPTENLLQVGNELWATNWSNYYQPDTSNSTVQVIDIQNDVVVSEIEVEKEPNSMVVDKDGMVWVLCDNGWEDSAFFLCKINPMLKQVEKTYPFVGGYPSHLCIDKSGTQLYFIDKNVCRMAIDDASSLDKEFIVAENRNFYNMSIDPQNGDIYVTDAGDYVSNGTVYRYTSDGVGKGSFLAGIIPSAIVFN